MGKPAKPAKWGFMVLFGLFGRFCLAGFLGIWTFFENKLARTFDSIFNNLCSFWPVWPVFLEIGLCWEVFWRVGYG